MNQIVVTNTNDNKVIRTLAVLFWFSSLGLINDFNWNPLSLTSFNPINRKSNKNSGVV